MMKTSDTRFYDKGSEMWYGDFEPTNFFRIENDEHYNVSLKHESIKNADCVLVRYDDSLNQLLFIEGKKNLHAGGRYLREKIPNIATQFMDSLHLACGSWLDSTKKSVAFPDSFSAFFKQSGQIIFVLIVKNTPSDELHLLKQALEMRLKKEQLIWKFSLEAYNEELAIQKNLVVKGETP